MSTLTEQDGRGDLRPPWETEKPGRGWHGDLAAHRVAGKKGGTACLAKYGRDYFVQMGKRGGRKISQNRQHMAEIGRRGGKSAQERERDWQRNGPDDGRPEPGASV